MDPTGHTNGDLRDRLRSRTLGTPSVFRRITVKVGDDEFEVRQPSVEDRSDILEAADVEAGKRKVKKVALLQVTAVIRCTYVPGTERRVFEPADQATLMAQPAGGWFDDLAQVAMQLLNVRAERLGEGSARTASGDSSSE